VSGLLSAPVLLALAVGLDLAIGDPPGRPHPVRLLGRAAKWLEQWLFAGGPEAERGRGAVAALVLAGAAAGVSAFAAALPAWLPFVGTLLAIYLAYAGLALGQLLKEVRAVAALLAAGDLVAARQALGLLVSRDTAHMDEPAARRALAETCSENLADAFVAPLFWLALFGLPGMWAYKSISTLDSMWGYKNEKWLRAGWFAARADDALAFVPARLSAACILLAGRLRGLGRARWAEVSAQARQCASPNAGWPMAAAALVAGARMGGPACYFGREVNKPLLGPFSGEWDDARLARLVRLCRDAGLIAAGGLFLLVLVFGRIAG